MPAQTKVASSVEIKTGMRVSLDIVTKEDVHGNMKTLTLKTVVEDVPDDRHIFVNMPTHQGYNYPLPRNESLLMKFSEDKKMYALHVQFEERIEQDGFTFAKMRRINKVKPHQQRDCYRIPCSLPLKVERPYKDDREEKEAEAAAEAEAIAKAECPLAVCKMLDLSDGGMSFATNKNIKKDEKIAIAFDIGTVETIQGKVLRIKQAKDENYSFEVAAQFKFIDKAQKNRIYKYIVDKQIEERRKWVEDGVEPVEKDE